MHVYEESLGSTCHNKGSIQSVKRGMVVFINYGPACDYPKGFWWERSAP